MLKRMSVHQVPKFTTGKDASDALAKGCSCGLTKTQDPHFVARKDLKRKSKCPCLRQGVYCSKFCKGFNCGNLLVLQMSKRCPCRLHTKLFKVAAKLVFVNSKHAVAESLVDSLVEIY